MVSRLFPESIVQQHTLKWLGYFRPDVRRCVIKIDNEGKRASQGLAVSLGLHPGASDLFIAWPTDQFSGLWLEVKRPGFKPTASNQKHLDSQIEFIRKMKMQGYWGDIGIGFDECKTIITNYLFGNV